MIVISLVRTRCEGWLVAWKSQFEILYNRLSHTVWENICLVMLCKLIYLSQIHKFCVILELEKQKEFLKNEWLCSLWWELDMKVGLLHGEKKKQFEISYNRLSSWVTPWQKSWNPPTVFSKNHRWELDVKKDVWYYGPFTYRLLAWLRPSRRYGVECHVTEGAVGVGIGYSSRLIVAFFELAVNNH